MGPAALPIAMGASTIGASLIGANAAKNASKRSPEEQQLIQSQTSLADQQRKQGAEMFSQANPWYQKAGGYYSALMSGDRGKMAQATQGPRGMINDQYAGAERGLQRSGLTGGARDLAYANLLRGRSADVAGLTSGVQPQAAQALSGLASLGFGQGLGASGQAGNAYGNLAAGAQSNRMAGNAAGASAGEDMGMLLFNMLKQGGGGSKQGGGGPWAETRGGNTTWVNG